MYGVHPFGFHPGQGFEPTRGVKRSTKNTSAYARIVSLVSYYPNGGMKFFFFFLEEPFLVSFASTDSFGGI